MPRGSWRRPHCGLAQPAVAPGGSFEHVQSFRRATSKVRGLAVFHGATAINDGTTAEPRRSCRCHCYVCRIGININKHLHWNHHNTDVANKIVKTLGILNILKRYLPLNVLRIIYNSLILPHLNYGILLWGHQAKQTKQIQVIQKRAVRILTGSKYNSHTEPLFKQINLLKVNDICKLNEINLYYKLVHKQQPQYFNSFTHEANSDIHGHNTRSRNELHFPKTKHDFAKINLRYRILQTINELPETVTSKVYTHSINGVTNYAKQYFISGYKKQCTIGNCYICQHTI